jgi:hypothetical protein
LPILFGTPQNPRAKSVPACPNNTKALRDFKKSIKADGDFKKVAPDLKVCDKLVCLGIEMSLEEQPELLAFLDKNNDAFAWSTSDLIGVSRDIIMHKLQVSPENRDFIRCRKKG